MNIKSIILLIVCSLFSIFAPCKAECNSVGIGIFGGYAWSVEDDVINSYSIFDSEELGNGGVIGGSLIYRFEPGFGLELAIENYKFDLTEYGENAGTLKMTPLMLFFVYQWIPVGGKGLAGHACVGSGINFTSFSKGPYIENEERNNNASIEIDTKNSFIFGIGGGLDYFLNKSFSIFIDGRFFYCDVDVDSKITSDGISSDYFISNFYTTNLQSLIGIKYWFH